MPEQDVVDFLETIGVHRTDILSLEPLAGGVSNDVYAVSTAAEALVVKRALGKLRVEADWRADVGRLDTERRALQAARTIIPSRVPEIIGYSPDFLALEKAPDDWTDWKSCLMAERADAWIASEIGHALASLQRATVSIDGFADTTVFHQLRTDPFHMEVGRRVPALAPALESLVAEMATHSVCLVHGDFSPKNVLVDPGEKRTGIWIIDWEVAHLGDPSFDPAFLLCHLLLKSLLHPGAATEYEKCAVAFVSAYQGDGGLAEDMSQVVQHTGALLLARVHGKSPVDYLDGAAKARASRIGREALLRPPNTVHALWRLPS